MFLVPVSHDGHQGTSDVISWWFQGAVN